MKRNQKLQILDYIKRFGSITRAEAFNDLGIAELSARIGEIEKEQGFKFDKTKITVLTRLGEKKVTKYSLKEDEG